ncbi:hypothetical protein D3C71_2015850 [compost metagenome]
MERPLAWPHEVGAVGVLRVGAEAPTAVLQADAEAGLDHARAKAREVALDEADHHAAFIDRRQVDGAALHRIAGLEILGAQGIDELGA